MAFRESAEAPLFFLSGRAMKVRLSFSLALREGAGALTLMRVGFVFDEGCCLFRRTASEIVGASELFGYQGDNPFPRAMG